MELDPVDRITADAVGEPGQRTFYLQARQGDRLVTLLVEKEQVRQLAASVVEILSRVARDTEGGPGEEELRLEAPLEPLFRAGRLYIGYEEDRDRLLLDIEELVPEEGEGAAEREPARVRIWATREQMLAFSRHGAQAVSRGRPACQFCGNPIDREGHTCPAMNGHRG
ncbi:MAG TPA: DUF3090 domain-containing protein [Actinomycetota bacterium]|nr:DUF3090 domain-containing protein [Actinomycetota bacterium]